jgi:hypothetical protein
MRLKIQFQRQNNPQSQSLLSTHQDNPESIYQSRKPYNPSCVSVISRLRYNCPLVPFPMHPKKPTSDANVNFSDNKNMFDDKKDIYFPIKVRVWGKAEGTVGKSNVDKETIMSPLSRCRLRFVRACACLLDFCFPLAPTDV